MAFNALTWHASSTCSKSTLKSSYLLTLSTSPFQLFHAWLNWRLDCPMCNQEAAIGWAIVSWIYPHQILCFENFYSVMDSWMCYDPNIEILFYFILFFNINFIIPVWWCYEKSKRSWVKGIFFPRVGLDGLRLCTLDSTKWTSKLY